MNVFNQRSNEFEFRPGPVFANLLLVDEINRASPKTQAALLECMQENQVTIDGDDATRSRGPFMVIATQNPIEYEGTYPLPEAQLDRFTMRIALGYPPLADEARMLDRADERPAARDARAGRLASTRCSRAIEDAKARLRRGEPEPVRRRAAPAHARATPGSTSAPARAPGIALLRVAKARALVRRARVRAARRRARRSPGTCSRTG